MAGGNKGWSHGCMSPEQLLKHTTPGVHVSLQACTTSSAAAVHTFLTLPCRAGKMLSSTRVSLNALAFDSTCKLIEGVLNRGVNLAEAFIDALGDTTRHKASSEIEPAVWPMPGLLPLALANHCRCFRVRSAVVCCSVHCLQERLSERFPGVQFTVEAKADATYPIVSAGAHLRQPPTRAAACCKHMSPCF